MLPGQANCKAFSMRINAFTLINVKEPEVCQPFACIFTDYIHDSTGGNACIGQQREVTAHFRKAR